ncbi:MAG TPA: preprotein translocase subunit SecG [Patescibacteria group bacterium]|nr:preprotein translocase subunit SecG [Patescibacteria group bacterium]
MENILAIFQILFSLLLIGSILLQAKGTGLGSAWGGGGEFYRSKRGLEKIVFTASVVFATLFIITSIIGVILSR